jgi:Immunoglobulin I-set domain
MRQFIICDCVHRLHIALKVAVGQFFNERMSINQSINQSTNRSINLSLPTQVIWYREGVVVEKSEHYQSCLTISNTRVSDTGSYQVVVRNDFGEVSTFVTLTVTGKSTLRRRESKVCSPPPPSFMFLLQAKTNVLFSDINIPCVLQIFDITYLCR